MAYPCTDDPNEVIEKIVSAKANADKFDKFVNGTDTQSVHLGDGDPTPTIRNAVRQIMADSTWAKEFIADAPEGDVSLNNVTAWGSTESRTLAERFGDVINVKDYGAKGNGSTDDTAYIQAALDAGLETGKTVVFPAGTYKFTEVAVIASDLHRSISLQALGHVVLFSTKTVENRGIGENEEDPNDDSVRGWLVDYALGFFGQRREGSLQDVDAGIEAKRQNLGIVYSGSEAGDLVLVRSTQLVGGENRSCWTVGQVGKVARKTNSDTFLYDSLEYAYPPASETSLTASVSSGIVRFNSLTVSNSRDAMYKISCISGTNAGSYAYVTQFNPDTKQVHFGEEEPSYPSLFQNPVANGNTFKLIKQTTVESVIPITVRMSGDFTISRDFVTSTVTDDEGFRAVSVRYGDGCLIEGLKIRNFDNTGIMFWHCYKSAVKNIEVYNCNDDGTGYGFLDFGSYGCRCSHSTFTGCRAATSTDGEGNMCQSVNGEVDHCTCYGTGLPDNSYDTETHDDANGLNIFYPLGTTSNQGFSTHGDALNHVIDSCQTYGTYSAHRLRGENETVMNCTCVGRQGLMFNIKSASGVRIINNKFDVLPAWMGRRTTFCYLAVNENHSWKKTLYILDNTAIGVSGQFLNLGNIDVDMPITNLVVCRNSVSFGERQDEPVTINEGTENEAVQKVMRIGVGGTYNTSTRARMRGCRFTDNVVLNPDATDVEGFIKPYASFYLENDQYVCIGRYVYIVRLDTYAENQNNATQGVVEIPLQGVNTAFLDLDNLTSAHSPIWLTVTRAGSQVAGICDSVVLHDVADLEADGIRPDISPLNFNNKRGIYVQETDSDVARDGYLNFKLYNGVLRITNKYAAGVSLFVKIDGVF